MENEGGLPGPRGSLVLFPGALGDAVCAEPAIAWLSERGPVTFCARGAAAEVAMLFRSPPRVTSLDDASIARLFAPLGTGEASALAWLSGFERIVSFTGSSSPEFCARMERVAGARVLGFPGNAGEVHAVDEMLAAISGGDAPGGAVPALAVDREARRDGPPRLVLHPGSGGRAKRAPAEFFAELGRRWQGNGGETVVLLGPAEEGERARWEAVGQVVCPSSVSLLAERISQAHAYVGNDAGPSHVAAAIGTPSVVLFTVTRPERFGPRGVRVSPVRMAGGGPTMPSDRVWAELGRLVP